MDTIIVYLNNMFASLPRTEQMVMLKQELLGNMEEKYYELKHEGKTENEAVGIVISEFGNIDELVSELGLGEVRKEEGLSMLPMLDELAVEGFIAAKKRSGLLVGWGVGLIMLGAALLILISGLGENGFMDSVFSEDAMSMIGLVPLILLLGPAIALFIYSGTKMERYKYMESGFSLPYPLETYIEQRQSAFAATYTLSLIMGVCLCVLSPIAIFVSSAFGDEYSSYGVAVLLIIVAVAVFLFVYYGNIRGAYQRLLKTGDFSEEKQEEKKEEDRIVGAVAAIIWPLVTCVFLVSGFVFDQWEINWIVFPLTGILFGVFSSVYNMFKKKDAA
ncbi:permease prefix domain 1-containing protein [Paenibacillus rhizoplanae]|uniref:Permease prefix domain 1-containing protein n=1 Tax=Paenibacillus rhizoplanae TaxID=1917181 RepID=A0ABW5F5Z5_9BACL